MGTTVLLGFGLRMGGQDNISFQPYSINLISNFNGYAFALSFDLSLALLLCSLGCIHSLFTTSAAVSADLVGKAVGRSFHQSRGLDPGIGTADYTDQ